MPTQYIILSSLPPRPSVRIFLLSLISCIAKDIGLRLGLAFPWRSTVRVVVNSRFLVSSTHEGVGAASRFFVPSTNEGVSAVGGSPSDLSTFSLGSLWDDGGACDAKGGEEAEESNRLHAR